MGSLNALTLLNKHLCIFFCNSATDQDKITKERSKFKKCCENKKFGFNHLIHVDMKKKMPKMD
jgi:hypothetical protein